MGSIRVYALLLWLFFLLVTVTGANSIPLYMRDKPRSIRGFKNRELSTARGFGKRADSDFAPLEPSQFFDRERYSVLL